MYRIYLDWGVVSKLKQETTNAYKDLKVEIQKSKEILIPYSPAHLDDLFIGALEKDNYNDYIKNDLEYLSEICKDKFLLFDYDNSITRPYIVEPEKAYKTFISESQNNFLKELLSNKNKYKSLFENTLLYLKIIFKNGLPKELQYLKNHFNYTFETFTAENVFTDMANLKKNDPHLFNQTHRKLLSFCINSSRLDTTTENWGDPFSYLSENLDTSLAPPFLKKILKRRINLTIL